MIITKLLFWIGLGGMCAGVYHTSTTLTIASGAAFLGSVILSSSPIITIINDPKEKEDK